MAHIMHCVHLVSFSIHGAGFLGEVFEWNYHTLYSVTFCLHCDKDE